MWVRMIEKLLGISYRLLLPIYFHVAIIMENNSRFSHHYAKNGYCAYAEKRVTV